MASSIWHFLTKPAQVLVVAIGFACLGVWCEVTPKSYRLDNAVLDAPNTNRVFITAKQLNGLMTNSSKGVTVLDARNKHNFVVARTIPGATKTIAGSRHAPWGAFTATGGRGMVKPVPELETQLRELGVSNDIPVVVYGSWREEWGEEGRVYWQLDWLGHKEVYILYGGIFAWDEEKFNGKGFEGEGDFDAKPVPERISSADDIAELIDAGGEDLFLIDSRTEPEYNGSTIYGVARGGHIPGAVSFHWKEVFAADGNLRSPSELRSRLTSLGLQDGMKVAAYCTGGVRSGFLYAIMQWLNYSNISNYPGSWWDWASRTDLPISSFTGGS